MKATFAQQAAAAARNSDHDNAAALYSMAALDAAKRGENAKAKRHEAKAVHHERMAAKTA